MGTEVMRPLDREAVQAYLIDRTLLIGAETANAGLGVIGASVAVGIERIRASGRVSKFQKERTPDLAAWALEAEAEIERLQTLAGAARAT